MKKILFVTIAALLIAACSLPAGTWTVTIPPMSTPWIGGPPMETEVAIVEATAVAIATEEAPQEESTPEPAECLIKGNVNSSGEMIFHVPGGVYYDRVKIDEEQGDDWFCSEADAEDSGFRKSTR